MQQNLNVLSALGPSQALQELGSSLQGLPEAEARKRLDIYGSNKIITKSYRSPIFEALSHSTNPLVIILIIAALISFFTGSPINAAIILIVVSISVALDFFQTHRSLIAAQKLQQHVAIKTTVRRNGSEFNLPCSDLVPGDVICLAAGDIVPADCLLLQSKDLHVQQAALTGESLPIEKEATTTSTRLKNPIEAINAIFSGSSIVSGHAIALVLITGKDTLFGQIAQSLSSTPPQTEFEKGILRFGFFIMRTVIFLILFVFLVNIYLKHPALESLLFSIALAVGLTPEFLPMITTVTLTAGALNMAKQKVIVKNLAAIQNFGSIDILCSDKTGTLTQGEMTLEKYMTIFGEKSEYVLLLAYLSSLFGTNIENPLDNALLNKSGINPLDAAILHHEHPARQGYVKIDEIPFDFERRRSSIVVDKEGIRFIITKGAPENIINICTKYKTDKGEKPLDDQTIKQALDYFHSLSQEGYRVLAIAYSPTAAKESYKINDEKDLILVGFLAFFDPPLEDAKETIAKLNQAGVKVKILTGDNELVTHHVCDKVGLLTKKILLGSQIEQMSDLTLAKIAEEIEIFARVSPHQKRRIIRALRANGHVVGYIGDGINDAPSLQSADVGISVSGAVDVAREAAHIILLEHNLKVLLNGIMEGRKSFGNIMKYLMMGTSSNFGNMLSMAFASPFLPFLPMKPTQILLNNLLYDISQISIPTDNVDPSFVNKPKHWDIDIIRKFMFYIGPISSLFDFITFGVMLYYFNASEALFQTGWFVESLATQTLVIFVIRTVRSPLTSKPSLPLALTVLIVVFISLLLPFSPLASSLGFVPLPASFFIFLTIATTSYLYLVEVIKNRLMWRWLQKV
ncbi:magnesium-translocating P-type ATPase [Legionella micdadei]|uniref:Magnesium-transporting ATPase, P-type 1 n=1 Tax=Legionella micdadei TaxID=451 RepID=A0A098GE21_LEGMI|nr:magnesium-translocating P-type ATPase [Legionella micdadei]ARG99994.1 magnesium-translocating P-type ATPase [Legionella micdadei]KTD27784.1 magnesium transporter [Legionella micdadei]CEG60729.1 Magnesium-transporting ATPase, P-type 1 [Legionella micdadei]SCY11393.1 Mg2+-importing ATPase [Legionella micdadei]